MAQNSRAQLSTEKVKLIGFLLSDASLHFHKLPNGIIRKRISINTVDEALLEEFHQLCEKLLHKKIKIRESTPNSKWSKVFSIHTIDTRKSCIRIINFV